MKDFLVPVLIAISIALFGMFLFGIQEHVLPRAPGIAYSVRLQRDADSLRILVYVSHDSLFLRANALATNNKINYAAYPPKVFALNRNPKIWVWSLTFSLMVAVSFAMSVGFIGQVLNYPNLLGLRKCNGLLMVRWR